MQDARRPPAGSRRGPAARSRAQGPVPWSRRMEEAREARATALAARSAEPQDGGAAADTADAPVPNLRDSQAEEQTGSARKLPWWALGGLLAGAVVGAVAVVVALSGDGGPPPAPEPELAAAPDVLPPAPAPAATMSSPAVVSGEQQEAPVDEPLPLEDAEPAEDDRLVGDAELGEGPAAAGGGGLVDLPEAGAVQPARRVSPSDLARAAGGEAVAAGLPPPGIQVVEADLASAALEPPGDVAGRSQAAGPDAPAGPPPPSADDLAGAGAAAGDPTGVDTATPLDAAEPDAAAPDTVVSAGPSGDAGSTEAAEAPPEGLRPPAAPRETVAAEAAATDAISDASAVTDGAGTEEDAAAAGDAAGDDSETTGDPDTTGAAAEPDGDALNAAPAAGRETLLVHAAPGVSPERLDEVLGALSAAGYPVDRSVRVDFRISQTNVRYFHAEDAEIAAGVAETISGTSRDFTDYRPSPDPGTIEVWLEG